MVSTHSIIKRVGVSKLRGERGRERERERKRERVGRRERESRKEGKRKRKRKEENLKAVQLEKEAVK